MISNSQTSNHRIQNFHSRFGILLLIFSFFIIQGCSKEPEKVKPQISNLTESIYASVEMQPKGLYQAYANGQGILEEIWVEEGQSVKAGQKLAKVKSQRQNFEADNARLSLELARQNYQGSSSIIANMYNQLKSAKDQLLIDSSNYFRQKSLWSQEIGSKAELDQKRLKYQLTLNNIESIKDQIRQKENELSKSVKQAENRFKQSRTQIEDYLLTSRIDGEVFELYKEVGELVSPQQPILSLGSDSLFLIEMNIDESDIVDVQIEQRIFVTLDAYGNEAFEARVTKIFPQKNIQTQTFKVEGIFVKSPPKLYPGMSGEANIVIAEKKNVLTIPAEYLIDGNKVLTEAGEIEVKVGSRNFNNVEIISGIDSLTQLIKP